MKTKLLVVLIIIGLFLCFLSSKTEYKTQPSPTVLVEAPIKPKTAQIKVVTHKKVVKAQPTEQVLIIADLVTHETSIPKETLAKIIMAESSGNPKAVHVNKNGTKDYSYFQINSSWIPTAQKMGLDIKNPTDNITFAIWLINKEGLSPWNSSRQNWKEV